MWPGRLGHFHTADRLRFPNFFSHIIAVHVSAFLMLLLGLGRRSTALSYELSNRFFSALTCARGIAAAQVSVILRGDPMAFNTKDKIVNMAGKCGLPLGSYEFTGPEGEL